MSASLPSLRIFSLFWVLLVFGLFVSCGKDQEIFIPSDDTAPQALLSKFGMQPINYVLDIDEDTLIFKTPEGHFLIIPQNSIVYSDGSPVSGKIRMQYKSIHSRAELIYENLNTTNYNNVLDLHTVLFINFTKDNQNLIINPKNKNIRLFIPATDLQEEFRVYFNQLNENNENEWREPDGSFGPFEFGEYELNDQNSEKGYMIPVQPMAWTALGRPWFEKPSFELFPVCLELNTPAQTKENNTVVYLVANDKENTVIRSKYLESENKFCINHLSIPDGTAFKIFAFTVISENQHYFGSNDIVIEKGKSFRLNLQLMDLSEIKKLLEKY